MPARKPTSGRSRRFSQPDAAVPPRRRKTSSASAGSTRKAGSRTPQEKADGKRPHMPQEEAARRRTRQQAKLDKLKAKQEKRSVKASASGTTQRARGGSAPRKGEGSAGKRRGAFSGRFSRDPESAEAPGSGNSRPAGAKSQARRRAEERERRNRSVYLGYILRIVAAVAAVLAVLFGAIFVYRSDLFHVDNVKVSGVSHLTDLEITRIAAVPDDSTLLRLDEDGIRQRLAENAWVQDVEVCREFPDTLELIVTERTPAAAVRVNDKSTWVVAGDGAWLSAATNDDWEKGPRIVDVSASTPSPVSGLSCDDDGIMNALKVLEGLSDRMKGELDSVSAASAAKTALNLKNGVAVAFGEASEVEYKEAAVWSILDKLAGQVSYINVRVPSRPTYRSLDAGDDVQQDAD